MMGLTVHVLSHGIQWFFVCYVNSRPLGVSVMYIVSCKFSQNLCIWGCFLYSMSNVMPFSNYCNILNGMIVLGIGNTILLHMPTFFFFLNFLLIKHLLLLLFHPVYEAPNC